MKVREKHSIRGISQPAKQYQAFISYKRDPDEKIAEALQEGLHHLARPWKQWRAIRVFRDITSLPPGANLDGAIKKKLEDSEYLILIASPESAASTWVQQEVTYWCESGKCGGVDKMLIVLTSGGIIWNDRVENGTEDFNWQLTTALPKCLSRKFSDQPAYLPMKWAREKDELSLRLPEFAANIAALSSTIRNLDREVLFSIDKQEHSKARTFRWFAIIGLLALTIASGGFAYEAKQQSTEADKNRDNAVAQQTIAVAQRGEAIRQRKEAVRQRNEAVRQRNEAVRQRKVAKLQLETAQLRGGLERIARTEADREQRRANLNAQIEEQQRKRAELETLFTTLGI